MAVAYDAVSESHTGTTGSASEASFTWDHNPVGTARGVLVFTFVNANADNATAVTYGGRDLYRVGRAIDSSGEARDCVAWFRGGGIPTDDPAAVVVTRTNNANVMYAVCVSVTASTDTSIIGPAQTVSGDGTLAEVAVDTGAITAMRFAGANLAINAVPSAGANSTSLIGIDFGTNVAAVCRETTAGSGSRSVGFSDAGSDDRAVVHVAVGELGPVFDAATVQAEFTTNDPQNFNHTPINDPDAVLVGIAAADDPDTIAGVTYGGVAMTREAFVAGTGEDGAAWIYSLLAGIPTGTQAVSIDHGGTAAGKYAVCVTYTATAGSIDVVDFEELQSASLDDPRVSLDTSTTYGTRFYIADTGLGAVSGVTAPLGSTVINSFVWSVTNKAAMAGRESILTAGNTSVGFDFASGADDVHIVGVGLIETSASPGSVSPGVISRSATLPAATVQGAAVKAVSAVSRSAILNAVTAFDSGAPATVSPEVTARSVAVNAATPQGAAKTTPAVTARSATLPVSTQKGGAVTTPAVTARSSVIPQVSAFDSGSLATVTPNVIARSATLPAPTVKTSATAVVAAISRAVTLPASTQVGGAKTTPAATSLSVVVNAATPAGLASVSLAELARAVVIPGVSVTGAVRMSPSVIALTVVMDDVFVDVPIQYTYQASGLTVTVQGGGFSSSGQGGKASASASSGRLGGSVQSGDVDG